MAGRRPVDILPQMVSEVLVTTAKAFKTATRDGKGNTAAAAAALETRIPATVMKFNALLDDMESDILLSKAAFEQDLNQLRAKRKPNPPEQKPIAPPAPMAIGLESPKMTGKEPFSGLPGPSMPGNQASRPVAPFPNMGFDGTSPKVASAPNPKTVPNSKDVKNPSRPAVAAVGRPASAPPKKDAKVPPPQASRPSSVAAPPQTPASPLVQAKVASISTANRQTPTPAPGPVTASSSTPASTGNENLFTHMTFSLAPPSGETQAPKQVAQPQKGAPPQQPVPPGPDIDNQGTGDVPGNRVDQSTAGPADVANMGVAAQPGNTEEPSSAADVDDNIDALFDLAPGEADSMDLGYDLGNGDNSNFNDMYFDTGDSGGGAGEFDDAFFNLDG